MLSYIIEADIMSKEADAVKGSSVGGYPPNTQNGSQLHKL